MQLQARQSSVLTPLLQTLMIATVHIDGPGSDGDPTTLLIASSVAFYYVANQVCFSKDPHVSTSHVAE